jgi:hypothetical protein
MEALFWIVGGVLLLGLAAVTVHWCRFSMRDSGSNPSFWRVVVGGWPFGLLRLRNIRNRREQQYKLDSTVADYQKSQSATLHMIEKEKELEEVSRD